MHLTLTSLTLALSLALLAPSVANAQEEPGEVVYGSGSGVHYGDPYIPLRYTQEFGYQLINDETDIKLSSWKYDPDSDSFSRGEVFASDRTHFGDGTVADLSSIGVDAYYALARSFYYFKNVHGRTRAVWNSTHASVFSNYTSARFAPNSVGFEHLGTSIYVGNGDAARGIKPLATLDIIGREYASIIIGDLVERNFQASPAYYGDAGGFQSAAADVFGTLIEFSDSHFNDPGDYTIGEMAFPGGLRHMYRQDLDGKSFVCYPAGGFAANDESPEHAAEYISGIPNRAFYLMVNGAKAPANSNLKPGQLVCNRDTSIAGIGRDKAGKIWYRVVSTENTSNMTMPQIRRAMIKATEALYGVGSADSRTVARAWSAAGVN